MMAIDPNIALGVRSVEFQNPLAQYGQIAAIQNAQNQNALAQFQLGSARRQEESQNALSDAYQRSFNPETGQLDPKMLISNVARSKAAYLLPDIQSKLLESETKQATLAETQQKTKAGEFKLAQDKLNYGLKSLGDSPTPQEAIKKLNEGVTKGYFDFSTAAAEAQKLQSMTPEQYKEYRIEKVLGLVDAKDKLGFMLPKTRDRDIGGQIQTIQDNPRLPGYGMPIAGGAVSKTQTFADLTAARQATTSAGQLNLAQQKFAWEQANPGFELKEAEDGSIVGVNKRTLQAFPVTVGGVAPAAAPMASAGMPGARAPAPAVQAIPGMTSVLDQQAPAAAPAAGTPLRGKGTALTETQSNATAFGMRMKEANSILTTLEQAGVKNTGLISGVAGSIVGVVPLIGDKLTGMTESVFNVLPRIMGGLSPEQQQVAQARLNFITANLRKESGATLLPSEFITEEKKYFPKPGDDETVIAQKQKARNLALKAMEIQAGPGAKNIQQYQTGVAGGGGDGVGGIPNATATNPLGLVIPGVR
jgi:hypothetical protein